jgi:hypothetical protein
MSWYGCHPYLTREQTKLLMPKGACKHCLYFVSFAVGCSWEQLSFYRQIKKCSRCGLSYSTHEMKVKAIKLGFIKNEYKDQYNIGI